MAVNELIVTPEFLSQEIPLQTEFESNIMRQDVSSGGGKVQSVNGMIGDVVLTAEDIGYDDTTIADALEDLKNGKADIITDTASGIVASFPDGAGGVPVRQLTLSAGATKVIRCGKNLEGPMETGTLSETKAAGTSRDAMKSGTNANRKRSMWLIPTGESFTVSFNTDGYMIAVCGFDSDGLYLGKSAAFRNFQSTSPQVFNWNGCEYINVLLRRSDNTAMTSEEWKTAKVQIEPGGQASAFEAYNGDEYIITNGVPDHEVTTIYGINNIWADAGEISVDYCADTKLYIQKVINAAISAL